MFDMDSLNSGLGRILSVMLDQCDNYDLCGAYGSCNANKSPVCECLEGFIRKSPEEWKILDWTEGCDRRASLHCHRSNGFLKYEGVKLPDKSNSWTDENISLVECEKLCLNNCFCTAYANSDVRGGGTGRLLWFDDLLDIRKFTENGQDLYVRAAASELDNTDPRRQPIEQRRQPSEWKRVIIIVASVISAMGVLVFGLVYFMWKRKLRSEDKANRFKFSWKQQRSIQKTI